MNNVSNVRNVNNVTHVMSVNSAMRSSYYHLVEFDLNEISIEE